jgi:hypothetical protein
MQNKKIPHTLSSTIAPPQEEPKEEPPRKDPKKRKNSLWKM